MLSIYVTPRLCAPRLLRVCLFGIFNISKYPSRNSLAKPFPAQNRVGKMATDEKVTISRKQIYPSLRVVLDRPLRPNTRRCRFPTVSLIAIKNIAAKREPYFNLAKLSLCSYILSLSLCGSRQTPFILVDSCPFPDISSYLTNYQNRSVSISNLLLPFLFLSFCEFH